MSMLSAKTELEAGFNSYWIIMYGDTVELVNITKLFIDIRTCTDYGFQITPLHA